MAIAEFSAVIFDLDGLVLDTESTFFSAWRQAAASLGFTLTEHFCHSLSGLPGHDLPARLNAQFGKGFNWHQFSQLANHFWHQHVHTHGITVRPGFEECLGVIKNRDIPFCLATNSRSTNALECLALAGLDNTFEIIIGRDEVARGKPEPDIFLAAATLLKTPIHRCLVLEDSCAGIIAASTAGAIPILIPSTPINNRETLQLADAVFDNLGDVRAALFTKLCHDNAFATSPNKESFRYNPLIL